MKREEAENNPIDLAIWEFENAIKGTEEDNSVYPNYCIHIDEYKTAVAALHKVREGDGWTAAEHYNEGYYDAVNSNCWVLTKDKKPGLSENDVVLSYQFSKLYTGPTLVSVKAAIEQPKKFRYWMPVPKLPK